MSKKIRNVQKAISNLTLISIAIGISGIIALEKKKIGLGILAIIIVSLLKVTQSIWRMQCIHLAETNKRYTREEKNKARRYLKNYRQTENVTQFKLALTQEWTDISACFMILEYDHKLSKKDRDQLLVRFFYHDKERLFGFLSKGNENLMIAPKGKESLVVQALDKKSCFYLKRFLESGISPNFKNKKDEALLFLAIEKNRKDMLNLLIQHHVNQNIRNKQGLTPIQYALQCNHNDLLALLEGSYHPLTKEVKESYGVPKIVYNIRDIKKVKPLRPLPTESLLSYVMQTQDPAMMQTLQGFFKAQEDYKLSEERGVFLYVGLGAIEVNRNPHIFFSKEPIVTYTKEECLDKLRNRIKKEYTPSLNHVYQLGLDKHSLNCISSKKQVCRICEGTGEVTCKDCKGTGLINCVACGGTGKLVSRKGYEICQDCEGEGKVPCLTCDQLGVVFCKECHKGYQYKNECLNWEGKLVLNTRQLIGFPIAEYLDGQFERQLKRDIKQEKLGAEVAYYILEETISSDMLTVADQRLERLLKTFIKQHTKKGVMELLEIIPLSYRIIEIKRKGKLIERGIWINEKFYKN